MLKSQNSMNETINLNSSTLNSSSTGAQPTLTTSMSMGANSSLMRSSLQPLSQTNSSTKVSPSKKPISIQGLKITTGNENGEIMKSYRESIEKYIKDYLIHQPGANTIYSSEILMTNIKQLFVGVNYTHYTDGLELLFN